MDILFLFLLSCSLRLFFFFFFNDTATTEIYTLSLHDALPISLHLALLQHGDEVGDLGGDVLDLDAVLRSEEHTSELQSQSNLVCRLLLEKKKKKTNNHQSNICTPTQAQHLRMSRHQRPYLGTT